ncbi:MULTISPECIES: hypothetical protein [unclassified Coleofasciculus]|uniref:hypothetical protein n=1 Tax=unclassified Coleofasciculus TaxID=2692782 RepID=UPI00187F730B|nr:MULTISPECIES: hypothetical protein [unclassified Coleofasciculus]MBE9126466.1 hypothetical protein [Coleofasciculus sp. LEGE 07081]MBE9148904.1 hypothetical protein [Coleofasciculus sp. LEGE 07092]
MEKIELELDEAMMTRVRWLAKAHNCTIPQLIIKAIEYLSVAEVEKYPLLGGWEDEPEVVDEIMAEIMNDRAAHPLNQKLGQSIT